MKWTNKGHEFDAIGYLLKDKENMFIFGNGLLGIELFKLIESLKEYLHWNVAFIDSDKNKQTRSAPCGSTAVLAPGELANFNSENSFVVVCSFNFQSRQDMFDTIKRFGYTEMINAFEYDFFYNNYLSIHFVYNLDMVYLTSLNILPTTICNLNCEGCLNFNPFIKKHITYTLNSLKANCDTLFETIDLIGRFQVTGGEPFLFPKLKEMLSYIREKYEKQIIRLEIATNGTVIPSDELCTCLKENNVYVFLDDYRQSVPLAKKNYEKILAKFNMFQITYQEIFASEWINLQPTQTPKDLGEDELIAFFNSCNCPWATIYNKSLSSCNYSHYATKAGIVEYDKDDYFELTGNATSIQKKALIEFRLRYNNKGYTKLCRQCSGYITINKNKLKPARQIM